MSMNESDFVNEMETRMIAAGLMRPDEVDLGGKERTLAVVDILLARYHVNPGFPQPRYSHNSNLTVGELAKLLAAASVPLDQDKHLDAAVVEAVKKVLEERAHLPQVETQNTRLLGELHKRGEVIAHHRELLVQVDEALSGEPQTSMLRTIRTAIHHALAAPPVLARLHPVEGERTDDMASPE